MKKPGRLPARGAAIALLCVMLAVCAGYILTSPAHISYLQDKDEVYKMTCGILKNCRTLREGEPAAIAYDLRVESFAELTERYKLPALAGEGTELERALRGREGSPSPFACARGGWLMMGSCGALG